MKKLVMIGLLAFGFHAHAERVSPLAVDGAITVTTEDAKALFDRGALFVDTRNDIDWQAGRIPDAIHLELNSEFTQTGLEQYVDHHEPIVCYCNGSRCWRSSQCALRALSWGFTDVYYFREGFPAWLNADMPVE